MLKTSFYSIILALLFLSPLSAQDKAHKAGKVKSGEFILHRRVTPPEKDEAAFNAEYVKATASFEFATRDDMKAVRNDWDLCLLGLGTKLSPFIFSARMVTDDESLLWNVGDMELDKVSRKTRRPHDPANQENEEWDFDNCLVKLGQSYILHTVDSDSDFWTAFRVTEIMPEKGIKLEWKLLTRPKLVKKSPSKNKRP